MSENRRPTSAAEAREIAFNISDVMSRAKDMQHLPDMQSRSFALATFNLVTGEAIYTRETKSYLLSFLHEAYQEAAVTYMNMREPGITMAQVQVPQIILDTRGDIQNIMPLQYISPQSGRLTLSLVPLWERFDAIIESQKTQGDPEALFTAIRNELSETFLYFLASANRVNTWQDDKTYAFGFTSTLYRKPQTDRQEPQKIYESVPVSIEVAGRESAVSANAQLIPESIQVTDYAGVYAYHHLWECIRWEQLYGAQKRQMVRDRIARHAPAPDMDQLVARAVVLPPIQLPLTKWQLEEAFRRYSMEGPATSNLEVASNTRGASGEAGLNTIGFYTEEAYIELLEGRTDAQIAEEAAYAFLGIINYYNPDFFRLVQPKVLTTAVSLSQQADALRKTFKARTPQQAAWFETVKLVRAFEKLCAIQDDAHRRFKLVSTLALQIRQVLPVIFPPVPK